MKKNDIALIVTIVIVCVTGSYFLISSLFIKKQPNEAKVKVIEVVKSTLKTPDEKIFHKDSINPAVQVFIGLEKNEEEQVNKPDKSDKTGKTDKANKTDKPNSKSNQGTETKK